MRVPNERLYELLTWLDKGGEIAYEITATSPLRDIILDLLDVRKENSNQVDVCKCSYCGVDEYTYTDSDWIGEFGYERRCCGKCQRYYKVHYRLIATKVEEI
jgi:hypothetical protein